MQDDIQWTQENREINGKVKEIMENDRATKDMEIKYLNNTEINVMQNRAKNKAG